MAVADFDGTGAYVDLEPGLDLTGAFTIWVAIKREDDTSWDAIWTSQTSGDVFRVTLAISDTDRLQIGTHTGTVQSGADSSQGANPFTVTSADGWCIVVARKPAGGSDATLSKFTGGGGWVHTTGTSDPVSDAGSIAGGKITIGRYQATSDYFHGKIAALAARAGLSATTPEVETLDGGNSATWLSAFSGATSANTDLVEPGMDGANARANWTAALPSINGLIDGTAFNGSGTIVTGDDPGSTIYTVGGAGEVWPPPTAPGGPPLRVARSGARLGR